MEITARRAPSTGERTPAGSCGQITGLHGNYIYAIQITIQEIMQAILDRRIDNKRAGLLLYSLQLASSNIRNLTPLPADSAHIVRIGDQDEQVFNDTVADDPRDELCPYDCRDCLESECEGRTEPCAPSAGSEALPAQAPAAPKILPHPSTSASTRRGFPSSTLPADSYTIQRCAKFR